MTRILLVEDDRRIASVVQRGLEAEGYAVELACDGAKALDRAPPGKFDLIILDRMLPGGDGLDICRKLREAEVRSPILMLTAKDGVQDKIDGLRGGADDYLTKPFAFGELLARIEVLLRRSGSTDSGEVLRIRNLKLDPATRTAWRDERQIPLTPREYALLHYLMRRAGNVVTREELLREVWNLRFDPGTKLIDVHIRFLRIKLDQGQAEPLIKTVRGFGYLIAEPA